MNCPESDILPANYGVVLIGAPCRGTQSVESSPEGRPKQESSGVDMRELCLGGRTWAINGLHSSNNDRTGVAGNIGLSFMYIVPAPGSIALFALAGSLSLRRRR